jgi:threonine synthase
VFRPYEVEYDYEKMRGKVTRESIAKGPKSLWRYKDLLPSTARPRPGSTPASPPEEGRPPRQRARLLDLWIKDDSCNYPTYSYKERVVSVAISKASSSASTPSAAPAPATSPTAPPPTRPQAGIKCYVMIPHDLEQGRCSAA